MTVRVDLFHDFVEHVRSRFNIGIDIDEFEVVRMYAWFDLRRIPQKKWKVHYSNELLQNPFYINNRLVIDRIGHKAECGEDLTPHASTLIQNIHAKDDMLADWGIYHLHPGHGTKTPRISGFVNRADELLFVFPKDNNLYFINVFDHLAWTNYSLIKTIDDNWPSAIEEYKMKDVHGLAYEPTEEELYELRKHQLNPTFRVGNSFFVGPGGGIATNGASTRAIKMALDVKKLLSDFSKQLQEEEVDLKKLLEQKVGNLLPDVLCIKLLGYNPKEGNGRIIETESNAEFLFDFAKGGFYAV